MHIRAGPTIMEQMGMQLSTAMASCPPHQEVCEDAVEGVKAGEGVRNGPGQPPGWACPGVCPSPCAEAAPGAPAWGGGQGRNDTARPFPQDQL